MECPAMNLSNFFKNNLPKYENFPCCYLPPHRERVSYCNLIKHSCDPPICKCHPHSMEFYCPHAFWIKPRKLSRAPKIKRRLKCLAIPKSFTVKYEPPKCKYHNDRGDGHKSIEILRKPLISYRLEQLSLPPVRKLVSAKQEYKNIIHPLRYNLLNNHIRRSMYTIYSRLGNIKLPSCNKNQKIWTEYDWSKFNDWAKKRAEPKRTLQSVLEKSKTKPLNELMVRMEVLAKPKHIFGDRDKTMGKIPLAARQYIASARIIELATPYERNITKKLFEKN